MQKRQCPTLAVEAIQQVLVGAAAVLDRLDRHNAVQIGLIGLVDLSHAAHGQNPADAVLPQSLGLAQASQVLESNDQSAQLLSPLGIEGDSCASRIAIVSSSGA